MARHTHRDAKGRFMAKPTPPVVDPPRWYLLMAEQKALNVLELDKRTVYFAGEERGGRWTRHG